MSKYFKNACEQIDAAMFSGDLFLSAPNRVELKRYMDRWLKELKNWEEIEKASEELKSIIESATGKTWEQINDHD